MPILNSFHQSFTLQFLLPVFTLICGGEDLDKGIQIKGCVDIKQLSPIIHAPVSFTSSYSHR